MSYHYAAFGLTIRSELHCPELLHIVPTTTPDLTIRLGAVPERLDGARDVAEGVQVADGTFQLHVAQVARYRTSEGREVVIEPFPGATDEDIRLFLLGTVIGAITHQRGQVPLHASAIAVGERAVAFCGNSGAGKSTLVAALHQRGFPLLTDDNGVAVPDEEGKPVFHPGVPRIRLWRATLDHFKISPDGLARDASRAEKFHLYPSEASRRGALPLLGVYFLERAAEGEPAVIEPVPAFERIPRLMAHTYRPALARSIAGAANHFKRCAWIAQNVSLRRFSRPWSLDRLGGDLDALEADIRRMEA